MMPTSCPKLLALLAGVVLFAISTCNESTTGGGDMRIPAGAEMGGMTGPDGPGGGDDGPGGGGLDLRGGPKNSGDCVSDAECAPGRCVEVTPGGFRTCTVPPVEVTSCPDGRGMFDECCKSSDCRAGKCYAWPLSPYCGGARPIEHNVCGADMCAGDRDCKAMSICVPAGALDRKVRQCMDVSCRLDTDCAAKAGGVCAPVQNPCCAGVAGLYCVYPGGGCRKSSDCARDQYCNIEGGVANCKAGRPICPLAARLP